MSSLNLTPGKLYRYTNSHFAWCVVDLGNNRIGGFKFVAQGGMLMFLRSEPSAGAPAVPNVFLMSDGTVVKTENMHARDWEEAM
jgi:hypothetical protein